MKRKGLLAIFALLLASTMAFAQVDLTLHGGAEWFAQNLQGNSDWNGFAITDAEATLTGHLADNFRGTIKIDYDGPSAFAAFGAWDVIETGTFTFGAFPINIFTEFEGGDYSRGLGLQWSHRLMDKQFGYTLAVVEGAASDMLTSTQEQRFPSIIGILDFSPTDIGLTARLGGQLIPLVIPAGIDSGMRFGFDAYVGIEEPIEGLNAYIEFAYDMFSASGTLPVINTKFDRGQSLMLLEADVNFTIGGFVAPGLTYSMQNETTTMTGVDNQSTLTHMLEVYCDIMPVDAIDFAITPYLDINLGSEDVETSFDLGLGFEWEHKFSF